MTRRSLAKKGQILVAGLLCGIGLTGLASAQDYRYSPEHRRPVDATLRDLGRISAKSTYDRRQRERYDTAKRHLHEFAERLHQGGYFDKSKLDQSIGDVQSILDHNRMNNREHDILARDEFELRELRQHFEDRTRYH